MYCPNCGLEYPSFATTCPSCDVALVAERPGGSPDPDATLESVFETADPAILPLATMTLDEQGIEYTVQGRGSLDALRYPTDVPDLARSDARHRIVVRQEDAARARELVADLASSGAAVAASEPLPTSVDAPPAPVIDLETGQSLGALTGEQARFLVDALEEESSDEARYYIDEATIDMLQKAGADSSLIALLRQALGGRAGMEIRF
ncbi:MAG TPA: zinc ribbon domain-containing protein [Vicinamibacterales bacterium]|nr:zinc ribbon domain-containing protein [Vicinamibacterales bacterium]